MANKKSLKRALLSSAIATVLSFSMLLGTTFAWFTDSVSVGINKIVSGNLDVELYHSNYAQSVAISGVGFGIPQNAEGEKVGPNTKLFLNEEGKEMLWEPGAACVESFRIKNEGSLSLKYQFKITTANATKTPSGQTLADILDISMETITYNELGTPMGTDKLPMQKLKDGYVFEGYLLAGEQYNFWTAIEWVPSDIDNDFNVPGGLSIDLGVTLLATQYTHEKDNYDYPDEYDKDATYPDISDALVSGGYLKLEEDSQLTTPIVLNDYAELDLNGHNLIIDNGGNANGIDDDIVLSDGATLTIRNGTLKSADDGDNKAFIVTNTKAGTTTTLNLEDVVLDLESPTYDNETSNSIFAAAEEGNVVVNLNDGAKIATESIHHAPIVVGKNATVNMYEGSLIDLTNVDNSAGWTCIWGVYLDDDSATFNMYGGTIDVKGAHSASGIYSYGPTSTVNIYGGVINVETASGYGIAVEAYKGTVNATGGTFNIKATGGTNAYAFEQTSNLNLTVTDGVTINVWTSLFNGNKAFEESGNTNPTGCNATINIL